MTPPATPERSKNPRFPGEIIPHGVRRNRFESEAEITGTTQAT